MTGPTECGLEVQLRRHRRPCVASIGTFDGVHAGHRALIAATRDRSRCKGLTAVAVTFSPRPDVLLHPERALPDLCPLEERVERLYAAGADDVVVVPFSAELAAMAAPAFVDCLRVDLGVRELCVGEEFALGRNRAGDVPTLRRLGLVVHCPPLVLGPDGCKVSSSSLRQLVAAGEAPRAEVGA